MGQHFTQAALHDPPCLGLNRLDAKRIEVELDKKAIEVTLDKVSALALSTVPMAIVARMTRGAMLEVLHQDYVRTARAKGLPGRLVISLHALPNALLPVITLSGILIGFVLAGSIPIERAFATPGLGFAMYIAVYERDVFVMQNLVFLYSIIFVMLNILIDVTIAWLDPRIRYR